MLKKLSWVALLVLVTTAGLLAAGEKAYTIGLLNPYIGNTWRAQYLEQAELAQKIYQEKGRLKELIIATCNNDVSQQLNQMNNMINQHVDCMLVDPSSVTALGAGIQRAIDEGILVLVVSAPAAYENTINYTHDNQAFASVNCSWLIDKLGGKGNIVEITGLVGNPADQARIAVHEELLGKTQIKVIGSAPANWSPTEAQTVMSQFISTYNQIDGVLQ
ncbi:MAG: substrate-binding domain-containing protein, partial [Planctomycetota bacterium]|nr:substrate-binding domain-containing protein [Planctomycetota bacterium]